MLNTTTNFEGDQGKRQEVSEHERLLPLGLALKLAWLSCLLLFAVFPGVVADRKMNVFYSQQRMRSWEVSTNLARSQDRMIGRNRIER